MKDSVVAEIRRIRHAIEDRFGGNPDRMLAYYMKKQEEHTENLIRLPRKTRKPSRRAARA